MRQVLVIAYDFPPSIEVGAHTVAQIARHFPLYGWQPVVLTVKERYLSEIDKGFARPFPGTIVRTGVLPHPLSFYKRLRSLFPAKKANARVEHAITQEDGPGRGFSLRRAVLSLLTIPDMEIGWLIPGTLAGFREIHRHYVDHLFSSGPCWTNHLIGLVLAHWAGIPWTVHFRDPWAQAAVTFSPSPLAQRIHNALEGLVVTKATFVVCVTEQHADVLRRLYADCPPEKFVTIANGFDGAEWDEAGLAQSTGRGEGADRFVITYSGSFYGKRTPAPIFRALRVLADSGEVDLERIRVDLLGWCDVADGREVKEIAREFGVERRLNMTGPLSRPEVLRQLTGSHLLLLLAEDWPLRIPAKTYEYLRAGRPILAITKEMAVIELLQKTGGAWLVNSADGRGIADAVLDVYQRWRDGMNAPAVDQTLVASFDRRVLAGRFAHLFDVATNGRASKHV